jgi:serine protease Do
VITLSNAFKIADRGEELSVNLGVVAMRSELDARHRTQDVDYAGDLLLFDAITSNPGAPGGAVVDHRGRLAGMIGKLIQSTSTNTRLNYAVPADQLRGFVQGKDEPAPSAKPRPDPTQQPTLGLRLFTLSGKKAPAYVESVPAGSAAREAGIRRDDLIMAVAGRAVRSVRDFEEAQAELTPGRDVDIILKRGQQVLSVRVKVGAKPPEVQP